MPIIDRAECALAPNRACRAARKPTEPGTLLPMYPVCSVTHLSGCSREWTGDARTPGHDRT